MPILDLIRTIVFSAGAVLITLALLQMKSALRRYTPAP